MGSPTALIDPPARALLASVVDYAGCKPALPSAYINSGKESEGFVVCSFCPRPYDFDPRAIPAPYHHANVMTDEVLFYASSEFMSRKGIDMGSITLHPDGLPHGPQPGKIEESIGKTSTRELAVMVDSFRPLVVSREAVSVEDPAYHLSWVERSR